MSIKDIEKFKSGGLYVTNDYTGAFYLNCELVYSFDIRNDVENIKANIRHIHVVNELDIVWHCGHVDRMGIFMDQFDLPSISIMNIVGTGEFVGYMDLIIRKLHLSSLKIYSNESICQILHNLHAYNTTKLILDGNDINLGEANVLTMSLPRANIEELSLCSIAFTNPVLSMVCTAIVSSQLKIVNVSNCDNIHAAILAKYLPVFKLDKLLLHKNNMGMDGDDIMSNSLRHNYTMTALGDPSSRCPMVNPYCKPATRCGKYILRNIRLAALMTSTPCTFGERLATFIRLFAISGHKGIPTKCQILNVLPFEIIRYILASYLYMIGADCE